MPGTLFISEQFYCFYFFVLSVFSFSVGVEKEVEKNKYRTVFV